MTAAPANFNDVDEARQALEEHYAGAWDSLEDWACEMLEDQLSALPEHLKSYFDFAAWGRDCELSGDIWTDRGDAGQVHVFWNY